MVRRQVAQAQPWQPRLSFTLHKQSARVVSIGNGVNIQGAACSRAVAVAVTRLSCLQATRQPHTFSYSFKCGCVQASRHVCSNVSWKACISRCCNRFPKHARGQLRHIDHSSPTSDTFSILSALSGGQAVRNISIAPQWRLPRSAMHDVS